MANMWFISDTHFSHAAMIFKFKIPCGCPVTRGVDCLCKGTGVVPARPFASVEEMNEMMVSRWNERVRPQDHIYHLGDVTMERDNQGKGLAICGRLHGHKRLIMGNHDHYAVKHYLVYFEKVMAMQRIDDLWFTHVPVHPDCLGSVKANIHGHIHSKPAPAPAVKVYDKGGHSVTRVVPYINISVENTDYRPVSLEELRVAVRTAAEGGQNEVGSDES